MVLSVALLLWFFLAFAFKKRINENADALFGDLCFQTVRQRKPWNADISGTNGVSPRGITHGDIVLTFAAALALALALPFELALTIAALI